MKQPQKYDGLGKVKVKVKFNVEQATNDQFLFQLMHHNFTLLTKSLYMFHGLIAKKITKLTDL